MKPRDILSGVAGESTSLWEPLHYAEVVSVSSDLAARRVTIAAEIDHLSDFLGLAEGTIWRLIVDGVSVANACGFEFHPTPPPKAVGLTKDQERALIEDWQNKGRMGSLSRPEFEPAGGR
jgi:hypothetical protein